MGLRNRYSVCGTKVHVMDSAPTRLNWTLENQRVNIAKYHEAVNMAIAYAISRPFGGAHTPRSCLLASVATVLHRTHRKWWVNKEMEGWMKRASLELLPFLMAMTAMKVSMNECNHRETRPLSTQKPCIASPFRPHVLSKKEEDCRMLKRQQQSWNVPWRRNVKDGRYGRTKSRWQQPIGGEGGQSSHDSSDISRPQGRWREMDPVGTAVKEKSNTWNESCKESIKRETNWSCGHGRNTRGKRKEIWSEIYSWNSEKEGKKRTKQGTWLKRCNATLTMPRIKAVMRKRSWTVFFENSSMLLARNEDVRGSSWQNSGSWCKAEKRRIWNWTRTSMKYWAKSNRLAGANRPGQEDSGRKTKTKINMRHSPELKPEMESMPGLCSRMGLRERDEGATRCLHAFLHEGKGKAIRRALLRLGWPGVERFVRWLARISVRKRREPRFVNQSCFQRAARVNAAHFRLKISVIKEVLRHCWQNRMAKRHGSMLPVRLGNLYDVRKRSEVHVTILDRRFWKIGLRVFSSPGQNLFESWGRLRFKNWSVPAGLVKSRLVKAWDTGKVEGVTS